MSGDPMSGDPDVRKDLALGVTLRAVRGERLSDQAAALGVRSTTERVGLTAGRAGCCTRNSGM